MNYMKRNRYILSAMAASALLAVSCSEFDDYNQAYTQTSPESTNTIWENISAEPKLSDFASLLKKAGYDEQLGNSRFYTVWAPENGTFNFDSLMNVDNDVLTYKFINSHVANFNYTLSASNYSTRVHTLNEKSFTLAGTNGAYTYDGNAISKMNQPSLNGTIHYMAGAARFLPNIYEYIFEAEGIDTIASFYKRYEKTEIDTKRSVEGSIDEDGNQTYEDTVLVTSNTLTGNDYLRANIAEEDSSFTILLPTDEAYQKAYSAIKKCYNYTDKIQYYSIAQATGVAAAATNRTVDAASLSDSLARRMIYLHSVFNNRQKYNRWVLNPNDVDRTDTLYSTQRYKLSNGPEILSHTIGSAVQMSNGYSRIVDSLAFRPWEVYNPELNVGIFNSTYRPYVTAGTARNQDLGYGELDTEKGLDLVRYLDLIPASETSNPSVYFYISGVRSTKYNIYVVTVPADVKVGSTEVARQYKMKVDISYADANGNATKKSLGTFTTDSTKIDTLMVGTVDFPVSYVNVNNCWPYISLTSSRSTWNRTEWNTIDNRLRIAAVFLRPVDYDEYLKNEEQ